MATVPCPHPSPLSELQDWYRPQAHSEARPGRGSYEIRKLVRHHHVKRSYAAKMLAARRRRIYEEAMALLVAGRDAVVQPHINAVADERARELDRRLRQQAERWDRETAHLSSPLQRMMHPSYQAILGMSAESAQNRRQVIRFLLSDLRQNGRDWLLALSYLTHENPINPKDSGKTDKMIRSWVKWGEEQGLL
jgi:hypothetical protein